MVLRQVSLADKYVQADGQIFLTGVQALVRLPMLQRRLDEAAGLSTSGFVTGYPGSPLASYDVQLRQAQSLLKKNGVHFQSGLNEDLAMTSVWGSQQGEIRGDSRYDGVFAMWYGKGAGLDRSGDALRHGNLAGASRHGGVLLLLGDDHRAESSSVAHYAEYTMVDFMMPVLNPADITELIEFGLFGIAMSRFTGSWVGMKCLHDVVESAASISIDSAPRNFITPADVQIPPDGLNLRYPDTPLAQERRLHAFRMAAVQGYARANGIDRPIWRRPDSRLGIVTTGKTYLDVLEALDELEIDEAKAAALGLAVYKVGMPWPLEPVGAKAFADALDTVLVVEEKRSLLETQLKDLLYHRNGPQILGKTDANGAALLPSTGVLTSNQIAITIGRLLVARPGGEVLADRLRELEQREAVKILPLLPMDRKPSFCSGCPHNRSTLVPENSRGGAGTGCNYMAMWMDRGSVGYTQMGADGVNWIGEAPFSNRKHVFQNLGDGTYVHSGLLAIRACVAARVNITFKILFNGVVAMTGGQQHEVALTVPGIASQVLAEGARRVVLVTDDVDRDLGGPLPAGVSVHDRSELDNVQRALRDTEGVTVLIYDQMCATEKRRRRKRGLMEDPARRVFINHLVCEGCGDCGVKSSCASILPRETEFGRKREIDQYSCNKDYSCIEGFCPSFVTVNGGMLRQGERPAFVAAVDMPDPAPVALDRPFNIVLAGIGGTGVVTLAAVLGMAAHLEGKGCATLDMMGLAQKGGAVTSHLRVARSPAAVRAARVPGGRADLVLGCDVVALTGPEPISTIGDRSVILVNTHEAMPGDFARQPDLAFPMQDFRNRLLAVADAGRIVYLDANERARQAVGDTIASNTYMLGFAFQRGLVPLSVAAIERAFELNGVEVELNKLAFRAGRAAAHAGLKPAEEPAHPAARPTDLAALVASRTRLLTEYQNAAYARDFGDFVETVRIAEARVPGAGGELAFAVAENLAKLMAYKDEYEVARLYTDGAFEADLRRQFGGAFRLTFHLAPPLLAPREAGTGHLRKMTFGPWILSAFRLLRRLRVLRGTFLDPFGHSAERQLERQLIRDYRALIAGLLDRLDRGNHSIVVALASLPGEIRGFGHVKEASIAKARGRQAALLAEIETPAKDASAA